MTSTPSLRPLSLTDILDGTFRLYRRSFLSLVGVSALAYLPVLILQMLVQFVFGRQAMLDMLSSGSSSATLPWDSVATYYGSTLLVALVQIVVNILMIGALIRMAAHHYQGRELGLLEAYQIGWKPFFSLLGANLVLGLIVGIAVGLLAGLGVIGSLMVFGFTGLTEPDPLSVVLLVLAGVFLGGAALVAFLFFSVRFVLFMHATVLERLGPIAALGRSWELTKKSFWRILGLILIIGLLVWIIAYMPSVAVSFIMQLLNRSPNGVLTGTMVSQVLLYIGLIFTMPLLYSLYTLLFFDQRVRREGYDIDLRAQQFAEGAVAQ